MPASMGAPNAVCGAGFTSASMEKHRKSGPSSSPAAISAMSSRRGRLPELLDRIPPDQKIGSVTADGAYGTRKCRDAIADRGANAVIPSRKNAKPWKPGSAGAITRNKALRASKRPGRKIWRKRSGCHRRSRAGTRMPCMKPPGQSLMVREPDRQAAKLQVRVAVPDGFTAVGMPVTEAVGWVCPGKEGGLALTRFAQQGPVPAPETS